MTQTRQKLTPEMVQARRELNEVSLIESAVRESAPKKLGFVTTPNAISDPEAFFYGKILDDMTEDGKRLKNRYAGILRDYEGFDFSEASQGRTAAISAKMESDKKAVRREMEKVLATHPLISRLAKIKGFTTYRGAVMLSKVKDISRFPTPSAFCVYCGVVSVQGLALTKNNLKRLRELKDKPDFGFNMSLKQQFYIVNDQFLKAKGFFYHEYQKQKTALFNRVMRNGEYFTFTEEMKAEYAKAKQKHSMTVGEIYMTRKNTQTVKSFCHTGALWKNAAVLANIIYEEWKKHINEVPRLPYIMEHVDDHGVMHSRHITLKTVLDFERNLKEEAQQTREE